MRKIMILMSAYTGHGHKSISDALSEQLRNYPDAEVEIVDGFQLIGRAGVRASKMYGPLTRRAKDFWSISYAISAQSSTFLAEVIGLMIHDNLMRALTRFRPDLIVSVHSLFNGSVLNVLREYDLPIPMVTLQADIVDIHPTWCDARATLTLCPTQEAYDASIRQQMPPEKLRVCGFPTRARFCDAARESAMPDYDGTRPLRCLLMSGGEGSGNLKRYAQELLENFDCEVSVICGRNEKLQQMLRTHLEERFGQRVHIQGFVENVQDYMLQSDLVIARGSPNTLLEAVVLNVPLLVVGALPGQEARNPQWIEQHNLGVSLDTPANLVMQVGRLLENRGERLAKIRAAQRNYRNLDNAKNIAALLYEMAQPQKVEIPPYSPKYPHVNQARYALRIAKRPFMRLRKKR